MIRHRLPNRRRTQTVDLVHDGARYAVALGYDPAGRVRECFISGSKTGSTLAGLLDDAAILLSLALQHGASPDDLGRSMGRLGRVGERASVIGAVSDLIVANAAMEPLR